MSAIVRVISAFFKVSPQVKAFHELIKKESQINNTRQDL